MSAGEARPGEARIEERVGLLLERARKASGLVVVLTGAGISAESGIPTFRGEEGYWTVGSAVYRPEEMATSIAFQRMPVDVWQWYLYRRTVCRRAAPNPAHQALVTLEQGLGNRFRLITQNVDGLHLRAGNSQERTYQVHGNIDFMRCAHACSASLWPIPDSIGEVEKDTALDEAQIEALRCPDCGARARPHVLWFDESYDELRFRFNSALDAAQRASFILVVGTSASTNLPWHVVQIGAHSGAVLIDVNVADNAFAEVARAAAHGFALRGAAADIVPGLVAQLTAG